MVLHVLQVLTNVGTVPPLVRPSLHHRIATHCHGVATEQARGELLSSVAPSRLAAPATWQRARLGFDRGSLGFNSAYSGFTSSTASFIRASLVFLGDLLELGFGHSFSLFSDLVRLEKERLQERVDLARAAWEVVGGETNVG